MSKYIGILLAIAFLSSCELLEKEETPVCKDCYKYKYNSSNQFVSKDEYKRLCGGDVLNWESIPDEVVDSLTIKYKCE